MRLSSPRSLSRRLLVGGLAATLMPVAVTACGSTSTSSGGTTTIPVVASTNVYADIVKAVGGDKVTVTSIISKPSQDPHSYEATAQDRVAVSKAKLVVVNGGGYDDFMGKLSDEAKIPASSVVNASDVSGLEPSGHGEFNEHVWYSQDAMKKLAEAVSEKLAGLDPADAQGFKDRAGQWIGRLGGIASKLTAVKAAHAGQGVAATEPVPLYLLEEAGLVNKTPEAFSAAVESGHDVPPAALKDMQDLISSHGVKLLAFNPQTESPQTEALKTFATEAKVPVVDFTETMPEGSDYVAWMTANVDAVASALDSASS
ncbi:metal ABC transporter solute-binding protein, Zn/Mn family [Sinomonas gamaensis]|uniref:metal ABC transporter solute-binding protein, Zn/Mn family n=1 Tax=Sinomonas gamaensis TaxID=2565624 RepID=UPI0011089939|nr:zinc ABC transporter substrate-binding protein [Sinomonas gamaensis]